MKKDKQIYPPHLAGWILSRLSVYENLLTMTAEIEDEFQEIVAGKGYLRACAWYWEQTLRALGSYLSLSVIIGLNMLKNYFKLTIRNLNRQKGFSFINIIGLAAGLACCLIIFLYVQNELTYDQYHKDGDRIYRVAEYRKVPMGEFRSALVSGAVGPTLKADFPQVELAAGITPLRNGLIVSGEKSFYEDRIYYADQDIFEMFTIPFTSGDPSSALDRPWTVVITKRTAEKYFGDQNPLGQMLHIKDPLVMRKNSTSPQPVEYEITGVVENPPSNTHFKYDLIASSRIFDQSRIPTDWDNHTSYLYIKLLPGVDWKDFEQRIKMLAYTYYGDNLKKWGQERHYFMLPLADIHFRSNLRGSIMVSDSGEMEAPGNMLYIYIYSSIGLLILLIGCMNFINISNARSIYRIKEIGLRKVVGARRFQLIRQLLGESFFITGISLGFACLLVKILLPLFNQAAGTDLHISGLIHPYVLLAAAGLVIFTALVAGGYPAFVLTSFKPSVILRGSSAAGTGGSGFLKTLVLGQFTISIFLAVGVVTVYQQLNYMRGGKLGFEMEQKLILPFRGNIQIKRGNQTLKSEFLSCPGVTGSTVSANVPGRHIILCGLKFPQEQNGQQRMVRLLACDEDFFNVYKIKLIAGRGFEKDRSDKQNAFVINRSAAKLLGFGSPEEAVGARLHETFSSHQKTVIGVTEDFHFKGMQNQIEPLLMEYSDLSFLYNTLTLSVSIGDIDETIAGVKAKWSALYPGIPYEGFFLDDDFHRLYLKEEQVGKLLTVIAAMGLSIACLGLLGLSSFMAKKRTKEIGIRKVMGASVPNIVGMLSKQFILLVLAANVLAGPAAYYVMNRWLQEFAYRINLGWQTFLMAGAAALLITTLTVSFQALRAAGADPVEALRYE